MSDHARPSAASPDSLAALRGIWRSRGYGHVLQIRANGYTLHEETSVSCLPVYGGTLAELARHYEDLRVSPGGRAFSVRRASGVTRVHFRRIAELPRTLESAPGGRRDPRHVFDVFWHTFAEHYALFELKGVDWGGMGEKYRPRIDADTTAADLFATFCAMLQPLRDGHVHLRSPLGTFDAGARPHLFRRLAAELERNDDTRTVAAYLAELREEHSGRLRDEYLTDRARRGPHGLFEWGRLDDATGYLGVRAMAGQCGRVGSPSADVAAVDVAMRDVLADLGELPHLVLDVRLNGGGYDVVALRLASCFLAKGHLAFTKAARHGDGYAPAQRIRVRPHPAHRHRGTLTVLTSELTASAAEILVLALLQHPDLTLVGESTAGILSDTLERHLPNGWFLTLSNELYRAHDDALYEDAGIPPHVRVPFLTRRAREAGRDAALDRALTLFRRS